MKRALIIGSGIAGLAAAIRLKQKGYLVDVFEASSTVGGKIGTLEKDGFRWDTGPSLFTMPGLIKELFDLCDENLEDYFSYIQKETICNYFWEDGTSFSVHADEGQFINDLAVLLGEDKSLIKSYLARSKAKYKLTEPVFLNQSLHIWKNYFKPKTLKAFAKSTSLDLFKSLDELNKEYFKNSKSVQFFNRFATYNGSSPYKTSGIMSMIPSLEMNYGTYFPKKGMRSIVDSLYELAKRQGVEFHLNEKVQRIETTSNKVSGLKTVKDTYKAAIVVSNMDVHYVYEELLPEKRKPKRILNQEKSSSALIFYWGVKKSFQQLDLHNVFFSDNYEKEFESLFEKKEIFNDPTIYINISSKEKPDDAPEGMENWFVMVNAPANYGQNWSSLIAEAKSNILKKLERCLGENVGELIISEEILDPIKIDNETKSFRGSLYGNSSNSRYSAFFRHPNFNRIRNLYFCGGSVHPGGGIPLSLKSAKIVSDLIPKL
ncbi:MAG: 1-hydroxycarotenoid 3,4-desaturase CrtD [Vicingaceae bacterium]